MVSGVLGIGGGIPLLVRNVSIAKPGIRHSAIDPLYAQTSLVTG